MHTPIKEKVFTQLRTQFRGALLRPDEEGYAEARRVWNGAINRHPALIARCVGSDDVTAAVRFARENGLPVAVRGGGHAVAGYATCDGGLVIDLSLMNAIQVDPVARTARGAGGLLWGEFDRATQQFGLATTGGIVSHTGIGGLTLGGGLGHLMRKHGLTVDNLLSVELVTADGESLHVDAQTEPELFWGLRGGGGNFGIATAFEYRLHPVGPLVLGGSLFWSFSDAPRVLRFLRDFAPTAPDELGMVVMMRLAPPSPFLPPEQVGKPIIGIMAVWSGDIAEGQKALAPLRALGTPLADAVRPVPYLSVQTLLDAGNAHGMHYYWRSQRLPHLSDAVIDALQGCVASITSPLSYIGGFVVGGAVTRVDPGATAVGTRTAGFEVNIVGAWRPSDTANAERHIDWVREGWEMLHPHSTGVYANFLSDEGVSGVAFAYGERLKRLTALKDRYDPTNFFRLNANIPPSQEPAQRAS